MLRGIQTDVRFGARMMRRSPGFTFVALVTMALGIGAATAVFSIVDGVLLRPLPYPDPGRIVLLAESNLSRGWETFRLSPPNLWDWQARNRSLEVLAGYQLGSSNYSGGEEPLSLAVYRATDGFLEILGAAPVLGRGIERSDLEPGAPDVVILSYGFWQRAFGGDPGVLGRKMTMDGLPHEVVGVLPRGWSPPARTGIDAILPLKPQQSWYTGRGSHFLAGLGASGRA